MKQALTRRTPTFAEVKKVTQSEIKESMLEITRKANRNLADFERPVDKAAEQRDREYANQSLINSKPFYEEYQYVGAYRKKEDQPE